MCKNKPILGTVEGENDVTGASSAVETVVIGLNEFIDERIKFWEQYGDNGSKQVRELRVIRKKLQEYQ